MWRAGDVVSIQLPNCYEAVVAAVATNSLGAVLNPLLPNYRAREISHVFTTSTPKAVFVPLTYRGFDHVTLLDEVSAKTGIAPYRVVVDVDADEPLGLARGHGNLRPGTDSAAVSELIFTSGTEATPKAIMHTEETANFAVRATFSDLGLDSGTVVWMPSPVGHSTGFNYGIRAALYPRCAAGAAGPLGRAQTPPQLVAEFGCNYTLAATTFLDDLVGHCERAGDHAAEPDAFRLRRRAGAGSAGRSRAAGGHLRAAALRVDGSAVRDVEPARLTAAKRAGTDGYALQHTDIEVRDEDGKTLAPPAEGELHIRGPNTSVGLARRPGADGGHLPGRGLGAVGRHGALDADGYLTVVGRKKEIIIRGGVNIAPREIEDIISDFPEVRQVAVVARSRRAARRAWLRVRRAAAGQLAGLRDHGRAGYARPGSRRTSSRRAARCWTSCP